MILKGDVLNSSIEEREMTDKEGNKRKAKISHVLLSGSAAAGGVEVYNLRCYDAEWPLPAIGTKGWISPRVKRYECFDGLVADVSVDSVASK